MHQSVNAARAWVSYPAKHLRSGPRCLLIASTSPHALSQNALLRHFLGRHFLFPRKQKLAANNAAASACHRFLTKTIIIPTTAGKKIDLFKGAACNNLDSVRKQRRLVDFKISGPSTDLPCRQWILCLRFSIHEVVTNYELSVNAPYSNIELRSDIQAPTLA